MKSALSISLVAISILGLLLSPSMTNINADSHVILSPRQQMAAGVAAEDVECREGFVLIIRSSNGAATCVTSTTSMKLADESWGEVIVTDEEEMMEEEMMGNGTTLEIELEEGLSMGIVGENQTEDSMENQTETSEEMMEKEPFSIGGIDLSMAAPVEGDVDAPITIIEFGDYQCPKCKGWFTDEKSTIENNYISQGIAKLYFIDSAWLGDDSASAAQAAYCADDQGKFSEYHSTLYTNQADIESGWASPTALKQFGIDLGLDSEMFDECLDSGKYADRVSYNTEVGATNGVAGTPYFFVINPEGEIQHIAGPQPAVIFDFAIMQLGYGP